MNIARVLRSLPRLGGGVVLAASLFSVQQAAAQTCQQQKNYDIVVSSWHSSVAQRTDGSWAGWGARMGPRGADNYTNPYTYDGNSVGRPLDIIDGSTWAYGASRLDGSKPLLMTAGSAWTSEQIIALTTAGLYAWGDNVVLNTVNKAGVTAGAVVVDGKADGLPPNVNPDHVAQIFATNGLLALVTKPERGGEVWVLVNVASTALRGDGSSDGGSANVWHRVRTNGAGNPVLKDVVAVRGQVASATVNAMMAHTSDGKLYAWGASPYFGDGNAATPASYATPMTLPQEGGVGITPKIIGVTAGTTMFVLSTTGTLYSVGSNSQRQLGQNIDAATAVTAWGVVKRFSDGAGASTLVGQVEFFSVQEHNISNGSGALITTDGTPYTWGSNDGHMISRNTTVGGTDTTTGNFHVGIPEIGTAYNGSGLPIAHAPNNVKARLIEVGGHTTVFLPQSSPQFCYVGHQVTGSMGDGVMRPLNQEYFNCQATPVLNICGASGFDYGDAPKLYENGGGANQAMHFYANGGDDPKNNPLFLGGRAPQQNDANPKNVVSGTKNVGEFGDYIASPVVILEEDGIIEAAVDGGAFAAVTPGDELPIIPDTTTDYRLKVRYTNTTRDAGNAPVAGTIHAWVDWNNNGIFDTGEYASAVAVAGTTAGEAVLTWNGLSNLAEGFRYIRLRITTKTAADPNFNAKFPAANVTVRAGEDVKSLGFAMDGEIEDHRVRVQKANGAVNLAPVAIDVTTAPAGLGTTPQRLLLPATVNPAPMNGSDSDGTVVAYRIMSLPTNGTLYYLDGALPVAITTLPAGGLPVEATTELWFASTATAPSSFTFKAIDNDSDESVNTATYTVPKVLIDAVNDSTSAATGSASVVTNVVGNDVAELYGPTGSPISPAPQFTITGHTNGANGTVVCNNGAGTCTYTPTSPATPSTDTYEYTICLVDNPRICDTAQVTVSLVAPTITPVNDVTNTPPGTPVSVRVTDNDRGTAPIDPNSVTTIGAAPTKGTVNCAAGVCTYTPNPGETGPDVFSYQVCLASPNQAICSTATVTVNIGAAGVVATDDVTNTLPGQAKTIPVRQNDTAVGGGSIDPASVGKTSEPSNGTLTCGAGACVYTPNVGFTGTDRFTYRVCLAAPNATVCDEAQVTVTVSASGLDALDDQATTPPSTVVGVQVTGNDVVTTGVIDPASVTVVSGPANGALSCVAGVCTYTPNAGFKGDDSFIYRVCLTAPNGTVCDEAVATVRVAAVATSPAAIPVDNPLALLIGALTILGLMARRQFKR